MLRHPIYSLIALIASGYLLTANLRGWSLLGTVLPGSWGGHSRTSFHK